MARNKRINVTIGDRFAEPLPGAQSILKALNVANAKKAPPPSTTWEVIDLLNWNDLPHTRLKNTENGEVRLIASSVLAEGRLYKLIKDE